MRDIVSICFEVDETIYPESKTIRGVDSGSPYEVEYKPTKDIKGDYSCDVRYGMLAGLNPAQGLIFMLQALGGGLISKDMAMRELPFTVNVTQELEKIEVENLRSSLLASIAAVTQAIPQMVTQGGDPAPLVNMIAEVIRARQKGQTLEDAVSEIFAPKEQVPPAGAPSPVEQPSPVPGGASVGGPPSAETPGMGQQEPQAPPDVQSILSTLTGNGKATGRATVKG